VNSTKTGDNPHFKYFLAAALVLVLGTILGTALWIKFAPAPELRGWQQRPLEGLDVYGTVPDFALTERSGKTISRADLRSSVWIADFIYTGCTDTCPLQSAEMARLQEELAGRSGVKLVSISVDPATDSPPILAEYAARYNADRDRWLFLTGPRDRITELVQEGFRLSAASVPAAGAEAGVILHSPRFVLVDREARIRGYYDSREPEALRRLRRDLEKLL